MAARPAALVAVALLVAACTRSKDEPARGLSGAASASASAFVWPLAPPADAGDHAPPRKGMVWIPTRTLVAGTQKDRTPRIADEELPANRSSSRVLHRRVRVPRRGGRNSEDRDDEGRSGRAVRGAGQAALHGARMGARVQGAEQRDLRIRRVAPRVGMFDGSAGPTRAERAPRLVARAPSASTTCTAARGMDGERLAPRGTSQAGSVRVGTPTRASSWDAAANAMASHPCRDESDLGGALLRR